MSMEQHNEHALHLEPPLDVSRGGAPMTPGSVPNDR